MDSKQVNEQAKAIIFSLNGYSTHDAVRILSASISLAVTQALETGADLSSGAGYLFHLCTGRKGKIEKDPEINAFLFGIDRYLTLTELHNLLKEKFGMIRAPSRSALCRYFKKMEKKKMAVITQKERV